jgi:hypothetical protein
MAWSLLEAVGSDRYLSLEECPEATSPWAQETWQIYESGFGAYCESRMDPMFHRLEHPATLVGRLLTSAAPVLVVGTGPSLAACAGCAVACVWPRRRAARRRCATSTSFPISSSSSIGRRSMPTTARASGATDTLTR